MQRSRQSNGACALCGLEATKGSMPRHLASCPARQQAIQQVNQGPGAAQTLYHLRIGDAYRKEFWLDLEMSGSASLKTLDSYLRAIWLECCGHLSEFSVGGAFSGRTVVMARKAQDVFAAVPELVHVYDFGTTSETRIRAVGARPGKPLSRHPVYLMARNLPPVYDCIECGAPATMLCQECIIENDVWGALCDEHAESHPHHEYGEPAPLVNSPRQGMCGYDGPAEPPY